jgi:hypothetical protein
MVMLDLSQQAASANLTFSEPVMLSDVERQRAIGTWRGRMVNEHISARVFAALIPQMMKAGLNPDWQAEVATMISDELRHGQQCAAVVHALGGDARAEIPAFPDVPEHEDASPLEAVLRNIMSISCLHETVAVALIRGEHVAAGPPEMKETLREILGDEVRHARFGWSVFRELNPLLTDELRQRLTEYLVVAFKHLREHELAHLPLGATPSASEEAVGVCDGKDARTLFYETVHEVIIPGLEGYGIKAEKAWKASELLS